MEGMDIVMGTPSFVLSTPALPVLNSEALWEEMVVMVVAEEAVVEEGALGEDLAPRLEDLSSA